MRRYRFARLTVLFGIAGVLCSCVIAPSEDLYKETRFLMGTFVEVSVKGTKDKAKQAVQAVFDEMRRVEDLTSFHKPSDLTKINTAAGTGIVRVPRELTALVNESLKFARESDGAFDPTLGPLAKIWNFSGGEPRLPEDSEIKRALKKKGWKLVKTDTTAATVALPEREMSLDLGGIAKGYSLDRAGSVLKKLKIHAALVNAGGDILALGEKSPGKPWRIGVQAPRNPGGLVAVASLKDRVIVTSGDYERFFLRAGKRYHHILNPATGYPATELRSVTIIARDGLRADAMATAVFGLGVKGGLQYVENTPDVEGFLIDAKGKMFLSSGAKDFLEVSNE